MTTETFIDGQILTAAEMNALATQVASGYTLPNATTTTLGGVIVGPGLTATLGMINVNYGTGANTAAQGNDSRITGAAQKSANLSDIASAATARTNLGLGGAAILNVGTITGTVAAGDDGRIAGAAQIINNLSDLANEATARTNLGLSTLATATVGSGLTLSGGVLTSNGAGYTLPNATSTTLGGVIVGSGIAVASGTVSVAYGTIAGTAAQGNDARIIGALQGANNLSDIASAATTRANLDLGGAAVLNVGAVSGTVAAGDDSRITGAAQKANNLSDIASPSTALTNLGGVTSTQAAAAAPVQSVATRTGAIVLAVADVSGAAPSDSPTITTKAIFGGAGTNALTLTPGAASSSDTTTSLSGTGNLFHQGTFKAKNYITNSVTQTVSGTALTALTKFTGNLAGNLGGSGDALFQFTISSDTMDTTGNTAGGSPAVRLDRNIGGTGTKGGRSGIRANMNVNAAVSGDTSAPQYVAMEQWIQTKVNVGGTLSAPAGSLYANNPQVTINPGATFWSVANALGEVDIAVTGSTQPMTLGGTVTTGDTLTVTFTSTSIVGSPVSATVTAGASGTLSILSQKLIAAINSNTALTAAGICAAGTGTTIGLYWPTQNTVTPSVAVGGSATETMTLGTFVSGGSVDAKIGASFIRLTNDTARGISNDAIMFFSGQKDAPVSGQWTRGLVFGPGSGGGAQWPMTPTGSLILATAQNAYGNTNRTAWLTQNYAAYGIDFRTVNFSAASGASLAMPGWLVDGTGTINLSNALIGPVSGGIKIDVSGQRGTVAIANGGTGSAGNINNRYYPNDLIFDAFGGQYVVSTVDPSTGKVTALTTIIAPYVQGTPPSNPVNTSGGSGAGLTLTITWAANNTLELNPSGGSTAVGAAVATTATGGFLYVPTGSGAPTGVPASVAGLAPMYVDTANNKFWLYLGGAWKGVAVA